ncbi:hypothetical protein P9112_000463 [Eukaryota sp. TZLM1-RC]
MGISGLHSYVRSTTKSAYGQRPRVRYYIFTINQRSPHPLCIGVGFKYLLNTIIQSFVPDIRHGHSPRHLMERCDILFSEFKKRNITFEIVRMLRKFKARPAQTELLTQEEVTAEEIARLQTKKGKTHWSVVVEIILASAIKNGHMIRCTLDRCDHVLSNGLQSERYNYVLCYTECLLQEGMKLLSPSSLSFWETVCNRLVSNEPVRIRVYTHESLRRSFNQILPRQWSQSDLGKLAAMAGTKRTRPYFETLQWNIMDVAKSADRMSHIIRNFNSLELIWDQHYNSHQDLAESCDRNYQRYGRLNATFLDHCISSHGVGTGYPDWRVAFAHYAIQDHLYKVLSRTYPRVYTSPELHGFTRADIRGGIEESVDALYLVFKREVLPADAELNNLVFSLPVADRGEDLSLFLPCHFNASHFQSPVELFSVFQHCAYIGHEDQCQTGQLHPLFVKLIDKVTVIQPCLIGYVAALYFLYTRTVLLGAQSVLRKIDFILFVVATFFPLPKHDHTVSDHSTFFRWRLLNFVLELSATSLALFRKTACSTVVNMSNTNAYIFLSSTANFCGNCGTYWMDIFNEVLTQVKEYSKLENDQQFHQLRNLAFFILRIVFAPSLSTIEFDDDDISIFVDDVLPYHEPLFNKIRDGIP